MAISVTNWVWDHSRSRLGARLLALALAREAGEDGVCSMSTAELVRLTGMGERTVRNAVAGLERLGELEVGYKHALDGCNRYRLVMRRHPADSAGSAETRQVLHEDPAESAGSVAVPSESAHVSEHHPAESAGSVAMSCESAHSRRSEDTTRQNLPGADHSRRSEDTTRQNLPGAESAGSGDPHVVDIDLRSKDLKTSSRDLNADREDIRRICAHLADRVAENGFTRPTTTKTALTDARLMLDRDGRTEQQVHTAIEWATRNTFWRKNVRSVSKLREHYERLQADAADERDARAGRNGQAPRRSTTDERVAQAQALKGRFRQRGGAVPPAIPGEVIS